MHARELVELAALVAVHAPAVVCRLRPLPREGLEQYWTASKCRLDRWGRTLGRLVRDHTSPPSAADHAAPTSLLEGCGEEIFTGEVLARVVAAVLATCDRRQGQNEAEPIGRSILCGHLEARHRLLTMLVGSCSLDAATAIRLDRLRRRCERWSDLLVGMLLGLGDVAEFAVDHRRAEDFAIEQPAPDSGPRIHPARAVLLSSLRLAFRRPLVPDSPNADLNGAIAASVLACFQPELHDATNLLRSLWLWRLEHLTTEATEMLAELLQPAEADCMPPITHKNR